MRRITTTATLTLALMAMPLAGQAQEHVIQDESQPEWLFVISAASGSIEGDMLTLDAVPAVTYFSDRPARIAGHLAIDEFVSMWANGSDSFASIPPNAVLSILGEGAADDIVLELTSIEVSDDGLTFGLEVLDGAAPSGSIGPASLFLDAVVNPQITD